MTPDAPALGTLLELLHRADARFETVHATYRIWRHDERAAAAWRAEIEEEKRRGAAIASYASLAGDADAPPEHEEAYRVWRSGDRVREEHEGGPRDRSYGVRVGRRWWMWNEGSGAHSNEDDETIGSGVGEELSQMLDPAPLLSLLSFRPLGRSRQAGRATITVEAVPRPSGRHGGRVFELYQLGGGAERYALEIDAELGVLLALEAVREREPFYRVTTTEIVFDEPIADERFEFHPPPGEAVMPAGQRPRPRHVPLTEAQQRAPFTVFMPGRVPSDWQLHCVFVDRAERPPMPAQVLLQYRSESGHESVNLSQSSAAERPDGYDEIIRGDHWDEVLERGTVIRVDKPSAHGHGQAQAYLERDGTFVFLTSETLSPEQLTRLAAGLTPAPSASGV